MINVNCETRENWSHEEYRAAVLQRQVAERESAGTTMRMP
jgi:hypothetical protein